MANESPAAAIDRLLREGRPMDALAVAEPLAAKNPRMLQAWLGVARAKLALGWIAEADEALERLDAFAAADPQVAFLRGIVHQRLGRIDQAADRLRMVATGRSLHAVEASVALGELFWFAHRHDDLRVWLASAGPAWAHDPRAELLRARVLSRIDPAGAIDALKALCVPSNAPQVRRAAGFEAVGLLDRQGRYREAFDLAMAMHADTTAPFDLDGLELELQRQVQSIAGGARFPASRVEPVEGTCLVAGLPRSGTTLLEQMLDRHPAVSGIGEYDGVDRIGFDLQSTGQWPRGLGMLRAEVVRPIRDRYVHGARRLARADARWTFDKTLRAWRWMPALACALPGARFIHMQRDPRDMAISILLSYFHPFNDGWTASLESIRRITMLERALLPAALSAGGFAHESIVYERLVADPAGHAARCLRLLGLPDDGAVLAPHENRRAVFTLSHEQVRRPINAGSIGRWRNYAFAFDGSWDALAAAHERAVAG
jgi:hypothetical protein